MFGLLTLKNNLSVNTYGLVYEWEGSDPSLKPIVLTAHQGYSGVPLGNQLTDSFSDVVPVDPSTVEDWTYPPFSGYFDG